MHSSMELIDWHDIEPLRNVFCDGALVTDSRQIKQGDWFVAYQGELLDGRHFIPQAIASGAVGIIYDNTPDFILANYQVPTFPIKNLRRISGIVAAILLHNANNPVKILGVTGTNGKTSITQYLAQTLGILGEKIAIMGTNGNGFLGQLTPSMNTTPDAVSIQNLIKNFSDSGTSFIAMEVSSHGIDQARVNGVIFNTAVFTNLTRDHLDYHQSFTNYFATKKQLFYWDGLQHALINIDDSYGKQLISELKKNNSKVTITSYGLAKNADIRIANITCSLAGIQLDLISPWGKINIKNTLLGMFNALNLAATFGALCHLGYTSDKVASALNQVQVVKGRMEAIRYPNQPVVIVDYAHTPDALQNVLISLKNLINLENGKIWCVFGCGGDRDKGKRALMGQISNQYADYSIITNDNPRSEDPTNIIQDILPVDNAILIELDRSKAIAYAIHTASVADIILIAGKGHETYQEIAGVRYHCDDGEIAQQFLHAQVQLS